MYDTTSNTIKEVEYLDRFQYTGGVLQFFPTAEGYVKATKITGGSYLYNYVYNYTDHLDNIRVSYAKDPETGDLKILDENHYYPFGLEHKIYAGSITKDFKEDQGNGSVVLDDVTKTDYMYKFQNQELQDELSLNWYNFKWRNYDPAMARFTAIDPLADEYPDWGAYVFSGNRVIDARELEGLEPEIMNGDDYGLGGMEDLFGSVDLEPANIGFKPEKLQEAYEVDEDESTFTKWNNIHGGEYDNRIEAYRAWQSDSNYHNGESFWDKTFRSMGYASMEARRDYASGGMNMYGGYGRVVSAVTKEINTAEKIAIQFGKTENQISHTFRHSDALGLDRSLLQSIIKSDLNNMPSQILTGKPFNQIIEIGGQKIQYTAYKLPDGTINIGRIHGIK